VIVVVGSKFYATPTWNPRVSTTIAIAVMIVVADHLQISSMGFVLNGVIAGTPFPHTHHHQ